MQKRVKLSFLSIFNIIILLVLLVLIRVYQEALFYDPFLDFFKGENNKGQPLPGYDTSKLFLGLLFRYFLNSALSIGIIYILFKDRAVIKISGMLYVGFFILLSIAFFVILNASATPNTLILFYVRRFIIQPLFLILFVPAFYYQGKLK